MIIYCAGPMRGYPEFNFPAFHEAEYRLRERYWRDEGLHIYNPARMDEEKGMDTAGMVGDMSEIPEFDLKEAMRENCDAICNCTHIYMLKGWENSSGARAEHALAVCLGLEVWYE